MPFISVNGKMVPDMAKEPKHSLTVLIMKDTGKMEVLLGTEDSSMLMVMYIQEILRTTKLMAKEN